MAAQISELFQNVEKHKNLVIKASEMYLVQTSLRFSGFPEYILKSCERRANPGKHDHDIAYERHCS